MEKLGIIGAMDIEIDVLCNSIANSTQQTIGNYTFIKGIINTTPVVIVKSGVGKVNAALCTQLLITNFNIKNVINSGIAGAIDSRLKVFDFVVSNDVMYHDVDVTAFGYPPCTLPRMPTSFSASPALVQQITASFSSEKTNGSIYTGRIASGDQFISDKEKKQKIRDLCNPLCVEMEGAAIAHTCFLNNIPFAIIRCISDMADVATDSFNEKEAAYRSSSIILNLLK